MASATVWTAPVVHSSHCDGLPPRLRSLNFLDLYGPQRPAGQPSALRCWGGREVRGTAARASRGGTPRLEATPGGTCQWRGATTGCASHGGPYMALGAPAHPGPTRPGSATRRPLDARPPAGRRPPLPGPQCCAKRVWGHPCPGTTHRRQTAEPLLAFLLALGSVLAPGPLTRVGRGTGPDLWGQQP